LTQPTKLFIVVGSTNKNAVTVDTTNKMCIVVGTTIKNVRRGWHNQQKML
jgi:hypothetical protein